MENLTTIKAIDQAIHIELMEYNSLDLNTGEETLIHADFSPYYLAVYDFGDKGIITQRGWEFSFMERIEP